MRESFMKASARATLGFCFRHIRTLFRTSEAFSEHQKPFEGTNVSILAFKLDSSVNFGIQEGSLHIAIPYIK